MGGKIQNTGKLGGYRGKVGGALELFSGLNWLDTASRMKHIDKDLKFLLSFYPDDNDDDDDEMTLK